MNYKGDWDYLTFGIIFMGIGFNLAKKILL